LARPLALVYILKAHKNKWLHKGKLAQNLRKQYGMRKIPIFLVILVLAALCAVSFGAGCGGIEADMESASSGILNGTPDNTQAHMAVVGLSFGGGGCSGTLISRDVVLTAGHCAYGQSAGSYTVTFGDNWYSPDHTRSVSEIWVHPGYNNQDITHDVALLRLSTEAPAGISPIPYLPSNLEITSADVGMNLEFVGFGTTETGSSGYKLTTNNQLSWVCTNPGGCNFPAGWGGQNTICHDQNPGGICFGDSGGPAFAVRNSKEYVAGIASYVGSSNCTGFACHAKVDEYETEIRDFVGGILGAPCTAAWECDSGFCASGVCCESACTGTCMTCDLPGDPGRCRVAPDGTTCPDSDACNGTEVCLLGECVAGQPLDCNDDNSCTTEVCDPATGCHSQPAPDGTPCTDLDLCNGDDTCRNGVCVSGPAPDCDDRNPCTQDDCDAFTGCVHTSFPDGMACGGGACGEAFCSAGQCLSGGETVCEDDNPCTWDRCDPQLGCVNEPMPDHSACGPCGECLASVCIQDKDCIVVEGGCGCGHGSSGPGSALLLLAFWMLAALTLRSSPHE